MNHHPMRTRSKAGIFMPKVFAVTNYVHYEPLTMHEARQAPEWCAAMTAEHDALIKNDTWSLVPIPHDTPIVGCKWVFKI